MSLKVLGRPCRDPGRSEGGGTDPGEVWEDVRRGVARWERGATEGRPWSKTVRRLHGRPGPCTVVELLTVRVGETGGSRRGRHFGLPPDHPDGGSYQRPEKSFGERPDPESKGKVWYSDSTVQETPRRTDTDTVSDLWTPEGLKGNSL